MLQTEVVVKPHVFDRLKQRLGLDVPIADEVLLGQPMSGHSPRSLRLHLPCGLVAVGYQDLTSDHIRYVITTVLTVDQSRANVLVGFRGGMVRKVREKRKRQEIERRREARNRLNERRKKRQWDDDN